MEAEEEPSDKQRDSDLKDLRRCWELAALAHFYRAVGPALKLAAKVSTDELERRLLAPTQIDELLVPLLNFKKAPASDISTECWKAVLKLNSAGELLIPFHLDQGTPSFGSLAPQERLQLLLAVAEARINRNSGDLAVLHGSDTVQASSLRPERIGVDSDGRVYWYTIPLFLATPTSSLTVPYLWPSKLIVWFKLMWRIISACDAYVYVHLRIAIKHALL